MQAVSSSGNAPETLSCQIDLNGNRQLTSEAKMKDAFSVADFATDNKHSITVTDRSKTITFLLSNKEASLSGLLKAHIDSRSPDDTEPLALNVDAPELGLIVRFLKHVKGHAPKTPPTPIKMKRLAIYTTSWLHNYFESFLNPTEAEEKQSTLKRKRKGVYILYQLIKDANYMQIYSLTEFASARLGMMLLNVPPDKMTSVFDPDGLYAKATENVEMKQ
jgi:hypothetical protein